MIYINIDGQEIKGYQGQTILELARENGIEIPTLCHDERVKPYGSCGLCVVEVEGNSNLVRSCATEARQGMVVYTRTPRIERSRTMTLELLLSDHQGDCRPPCMKACPAQTDCQGYVGLIANGQVKEAAALIKERLPLPASIGLICPHPCEDSCRRRMVEEPVAIAALKAFAGCYDLDSGNPYRPEMKPASGKKVAIAGSGPAGLTAAYFLARQGHGITIYEAMPKAGGMLRYGIPEYRLPKGILDKEIDLIEKMGVTIITNTRIGRDIALSYLQQEYDAVFLGIGAWKSSRIGCPGEDTPGVIGGIDFLREVARQQPVYIGQRVAVIGGGNTAMDAARTAVRLGASEVTVLYRRTRAEMPAEDLEIREAEEEGVIFKFLVAPLKITGSEERVHEIRMQKMQLGEADSSGRRSPVPIPGEEEVIKVDTIIAAIGQQVDAADLNNVALERWGTVEADQVSLMTNLEGVFAGGDAVTGPKIAIQAVAQGQQAADAIQAYLQGREFEHRPQFTVEKNVTAEDYAGHEHQSRIHPHHADPQKRKKNFAPVAELYTMEEALQEANRCLECGCADYFECKLLAYANDYQVQPQRWEGEKHGTVSIEEHPLINREPEKCILCGLCVRMCDEVIGPGALGLVQRGFDTVVLPEFGLPLQQTQCISCGQCVAVCPTGALTERPVHRKAVPLPLSDTASHCSLCSLGCEMVVQTHGGQVIRVIPAEGKVLCTRGRFGWQALEEKRLTRPLVRNRNGLQEVSWSDAVTAITRLLQRSGSQKPRRSTGVFVNPEWPQEDVAAAAHLAKSGLNATGMGSFGPQPWSALPGVGVADLITNQVDEILRTDVLLMLGDFSQSQVAAVMARQAVQNGVDLLAIRSTATLLDDQSVVGIHTAELTAALQQTLAAVLQEGWVNKDKAGTFIPDWERATQKLTAVNPNEQAQEIARRLGTAPHAMIVIDGYSLADDAVELAFMIAALTGHLGSPRNGVILVSPGANAWGAWQMGFRQGKNMLQALRDNRMDAVFILDEDPVGDGVLSSSTLEACDLVVVAASQLNATARTAHVVLPVPNRMERMGTLFSSAGPGKRVHRAKGPVCGQETVEILLALAGRLGSTE